MSLTSKVTVSDSAYADTATGTLAAARGRGSGGRRDRRPAWRPKAVHLWYVIAAISVLFVVMPIAIFYAQAFEDGGAAIGRLTNLPRFGQTLLTTVALAVGSTVLALVVAVVMAVLVQRVPARFRGIATIIPLLPLMVPQVALIIGWVFVFAPTVGYGNTLLRQLPFFSGLVEGPFNVYSAEAIILITGLDLAGIAYTMVSARFQEIRGSLEAAARLSGASRFTAFRTVTLPLLRPALLAGAVTTFLLGLGQFTAPLLLGGRAGIDVLTTEIFRVRESFPIDYALTAAIGLPLVAIGILSIVFQRLTLGDQRRYASQGSSGGVPSRETSIWAFVIIVVYAAVTVVLPLIGLGLVAFSKFWNGNLAQIEFTLDHVISGLTDPVLLSSVQNTVVFSLAAILIAVPIGFIGAMAMTSTFRAPKFAQYALDLAFVTPLAVPRAVLGIAVMFVFLQPPFNLFGSPWLFVIGYVYIVLPFALRAQHSSLLGVDPRLYEAARVSGAGYFRTLWGIALPLARRGVAAAATVMFILLSHDFAVSVMLRTPRTYVMGTLLYDTWTTGVYPEVAVLALVITAVTGIGVALTLLVGGRSALEKM
ncbi:ABC transporter permease [Microbacterium invictum]|uniref:Iron(III) transport system permease protein n=1 Tax=Microbacterium invictum TaxID=515415 RepID=A0AA40SRX7_9MICO|nr:ABC transporter permease subunit [Microbacterium invictum]MBB4141298.1 iron(III) transport system permease protein [Microbacterium invictum]